MTQEQLELLLDYVDYSLRVIEYEIRENQAPHFMQRDLDKIRSILFGTITGEQD